MRQRSNNGGERELEKSGGIEIVSQREEIGLRFGNQKTNVRSKRRLVEQLIEDMNFLILEYELFRE